MAGLIGSNWRTPHTHARARTHVIRFQVLRKWSNHHEVILRSTWFRQKFTVLFCKNDLSRAVQRRQSVKTGIQCGRKRAIVIPERLLSMSCPRAVEITLISAELIAPTDTFTLYKLFILGLPVCICTSVNCMVKFSMRKEGGVKILGANMLHAGIENICKGLWSVQCPKPAVTPLRSLKAAGGCSAAAIEFLSILGWEDDCRCTWDSPEPDVNYAGLPLSDPAAEKNSQEAQTVCMLLNEKSPV